MALDCSLTCILSLEDIRSSEWNHLSNFGRGQFIILWRFSHNFKTSVGKPNFSKQFKKIIKHKNVGYVTVCMSGCKPNHVYSYGFLFNCKRVGQASESLMALT